MVGTSGWTDLMHLPSLASHPQAEIRAICGRTRAPAEALAARYRIKAIHSDHRALLDRGDLDAVVIATPDDTHFEIVMAALGRGLHVLCEKPLANTRGDAEAMAAAAARAGVVHMTLFTWRSVPVWRRLKAAIDDGAVGRPVAARLAFRGGSAFETGYRWRSDASRSNGVLGDLGSHLIDFTRWTLGEIESVSATILTQVDRGGAEPTPANDTAALDMLTTGGAHVCVDVSDTALLGDALFRFDALVLGTDGGLEGRMTFLGVEAGAWLRLSTADGAPWRVIHEETFAPDASPPDFLGVFTRKSVGPRAFVDAVLAGRPATPDFLDGAAAQRVIDAAIRSHASGRRILVAQG